MTSSGKLGIALLSFAHVHATGYANEVKNNPDCEIVAIWDEDAERGRTESETRGVEFYENLDDLLALPIVDGVVCSAPTTMHHDVLISAAKANKHIFTEKALTITTAEATEVVEAVVNSGVRFMISLPSRCRPEILFAKSVLDQGLLGSVTMMRARVAHMAALDSWFKDGSAWFGDEEQAGGGAFFDLGCHRVDVMRWFLGPPRSVVSQMNNFSGNYNIDDNMVSTISFHNNAIGVIDVSWVHRHGPNPLEIYGTEGYLGIDTSLNGPRVQIVSNLLAAGEIKGVINPSNLPTAMPSPMQQWVNAIKNGTTMEMNIHDGFYLTQLMEGCYTAARHGHEFTF